MLGRHKIGLSIMGHRGSRRPRDGLTGAYIRL